MDIFKIAATVHVACGDWCSCGESLRDCWFQAIYYPYVNLCAQTSYEKLFA